MGIIAGVGFSILRNPAKAVQESLEIASAKMGSTHPKLVILFCAAGYNPETVLQAVRNSLPGVPLIGCSAEGIITGRQSIEGAFGIEIVLLASDDVDFHVASQSSLKSESYAAGKNLGKVFSEIPKDEAVGIMLFPDGLTVNFDQLSAGLTETFKPSKFIPIFGGLASENWQFQQTHQFCNDEVLTDSVVGVLISGNTQIVFGVNHGCIPIGQAMTITKSKENVIMEIDHRPALEIMREYFDIFDDDSWSKATNNLTLALKAKGKVKDLDEYVVRYMPARDPIQKTFSIATEIKTGTQVWLARRDYEKMEKGVFDLIDSMGRQIKGKSVDFFFQFDCAGRGNVVFKEEEKQGLLASLHNGIAPNVPWAGFHCFGELGPVGSENHFHNYTVVLAGFLSSIS